MTSPHVVVVAYGPPDHLRATIGGLDGRYPVTVVDNSGTEATREVVDAVGATYIDAGGNVGFAAGVNIALRTIEPGTDVLLLNPDALVTPGVVDRLSAALAGDPLAAVAAPALKDPETGAAAKVAWPFPSPGRAWSEALGLGRLRPRQDFLIGAVLLVSGKALAEIGRLDERYFLYAEEVDWQKRATMAGWHVALCSDATATHVGAGTGGDPTWREATFHTSVERYIRKWHGRAGWTSFRCALLLGKSIRSVVLTGTRRVDARRQFRLYLRGPASSGAAQGPPRQPPSITGDR